jgi:hypothetical protein
MIPHHKTEEEKWMYLIAKSSTASAVTIKIATPRNY